MLISMIATLTLVHCSERSSSAVFGGLFLGTLIGIYLYFFSQGYALNIIWKGMDIGILAGAYMHQVFDYCKLFRRHTAPPNL